MSQVLNTAGASSWWRRGSARAALLALVLVCVLGQVRGSAAPGDLVYATSVHGSPVAGVDRDATLPVGTCRQCHVSRAVPNAPNPFGLFAPPDNSLCFECHAGTGGHGVYLGQTTFDAASHWLSNSMLWPGPTPAARTAGDEGLCLNCHTPHGRRDASGLVPVLAVDREESLCLACHDANGPAHSNIRGQVEALDGHPVASVAGVHSVAEGLAPGAFGTASRHAECNDCHNPHSARASAPLLGTTRVRVTNGAARTIPTYQALSGGNTTPIVEYQLCFKCHSSWTTRPAGARDLAMELNPANASFHPIEAAGTNTSSQMAQSLAGGTGSPALTITSVITCSDCHSSDAIPTNLTRVSGYTGAVPTGPHGSNAGATAGFSGSILRAPYRVELKARSAAYAAGDFALCGICHSLAPFSAGGTDSRPDTAFRFHGLHSRGIAGQGSGTGDIRTPGAGQGNGICAECHYSLHGVAGAFHSGNTSNARLVNFAPNVTGSSGTGQPTWTPGRCTLRCHGQSHNSESY